MGQDFSSFPSVAVGCAAFVLLLLQQRNASVFLKIDRPHIVVHQTEGRLSTDMALGDYPDEDSHSAKFRAGSLVSYGREKGFQSVIGNSSWALGYSILFWTKPVAQF